MTTLGKTLVVMAVALGLTFFGFAVGIATNHIDWPGGMKTPSGETSQGEIARIKQEFERTSKEAAEAHTRLQGEADSLARLEKRRPEMTKWYTEQIRLAEESPTGQVVNSLEKKDGRIVLDKDGRPRLEPSNPALASRVAYQQQLAQMNQDIAQRAADIGRLVAEEKRLTLQINGEPGGSRGLRALLREEEVAQQNARAEADDLVPVRINLQVEAQLLEKRERSLASRLEELRAAGIAAAPPTTLLDTADRSRHTPRP